VGGHPCQGNTLAQPRCGRCRLDGGDGAGCCGLRSRSL